MPSDLKERTCDDQTVRNTFDAVTLGQRHRRRKSMSNRPGQDGTVVLKNGQWRGRYLEDVPGQYERVYRSVYLAPAQGPNKITKTDARKLLDEIILKRGINSAEHLNQALSPVEVQTFKQKAKWWEDNKAVFFKPATLLTMQGQ